ncbi:MAG: hypothetical protein RI885_218 [Actinomycetota bacterium]|jgi:hypothetical protein
MRFRAKILLAGKNNTGIVVPPEVIEALGAGRKPAVSVTVNGFTYRSTVASMGGRYLISVSAERRAATGIQSGVEGQEVDVDLELDTSPREVDLPDDLRRALEADAAALAAYEKLSYSHQNRHVLSVTEAKTEATRQRRIHTMITTLGGK